jgi:hypothetical protein
LRILAGAELAATAAVKNAFDETQTYKPLSDVEKILATAAIAGTWTSNGWRRVPMY